MFEIPDENIFDEEVSSEKKEKLDIFKTLAAIDKNQKEFLKTVTVEEKKSFAAVVVMKWMSGYLDSNKNLDVQLQLLNEIVNVNFWELSKHPELQFKLMTLCSAGGFQKRSWITLPQRKTEYPIIKFMMEQYPSSSYSEIEMLIKKHSFESISEYIDRFALPKDQVEKLVMSYGKLTNTEVIIQANKKKRKQ